MSLKRNIKDIIVKLNLIDILRLPLFLCWIFPIDNKKVFGINFSGKDYGDNAKYIIEELHKQDSSLKFVWTLNRKLYKKNNLPEYVKPVLNCSPAFFFHLATSKFWINNSRFEQFVIKRKSQYYIQTWHGGIALKKIEMDASDKLSLHYHKVIKNDNKMIDLMLSNSNFCSEMYRRAFLYKGRIFECGSPRNDFLINADREKITQKIKKTFNISNSSKIVLYAPTFRNKYSSNPYDINFSKLISSLKEKTNDDWQIIIKLHPRIEDTSLFIDENYNYIDATKYPDVQELILAADLVITDYSSVMFESMIANKWVELYANDINSYINERGFYFKFSELPFDLAVNNEKLINNIQSYTSESLNEEYKDFEKKIGLKESGNASKNVADLILKLSASWKS